MDRNSQSNDLISWGMRYGYRKCAADSLAYLVGFGWNSTSSLLGFGARAK